MARASARVENVTDEQWETTTPGTVWIKVTANNGDLRDVSVGGRAGMKFRVTHEDRVYNQDLVVEPKHDPFTNGLLNRVKGTEPVHPPLQQTGWSIDEVDAEPEAPSQMISTAELVAILAKHGNAFRSALGKLNETNLRRLDALAIEMPEDQQPTVAQKAALDERLAGFKPGGTQLDKYGRAYASYDDDGGGGTVSAAGSRL